MFLSNNKKGFISLGEVIVAIAIIAILAYMAHPNYHRRGSRVSNRQKACFSNIRVIQGAVEMYNMDVSTMMDTLDMNQLISDKYLKPITPPETSCSYHGEKLIDNGEVYCDYHGSLSCPKQIE